MPNWVTCRLDMGNVSESRRKQIREFVSSENEIEEGRFEKIEFDFNKIIPMPEELNVHSGSSEDETIALYLAYCRPESEYDESLEIDEETFKEIRMTDKEAYEWFGRIPKAVPIYPDDLKLLSRKSNLYCEKEDEYPALVCGRRYFLNKLLYGHQTWYDWNRAKWDTKWNACRSQETDAGWIFETAWSAPLNVIRVLSEIFPEVEFTLRYADEDIGANCGEIHLLSGQIEYEVSDFSSPLEADEFAISVIYGCSPEEAGFKYDNEEERWAYDFDSEDV